MSEPNYPHLDKNKPYPLAGILVIDIPICIPSTPLTVKINQLQFDAAMIIYGDY